MRPAGWMSLAMICVAACVSAVRADVIALDDPNYAARVAELQSQGAFIGIDGLHNRLFDGKDHIDTRFCLCASCSSGDHSDTAGTGGHGHGAEGSNPFASGDYSLSTYQWGGSSGQGVSAALTYSFMATGITIDETHPSIGGPMTSSTHLGDFMPSGWKGQIQLALQSWTDVADITFVEIADGGEDFDTNFGPQLSGDIRFAGHPMDGASGTLAHAFYPSPGWNGAGDTHFDTAETWKIGFGGGGFDIFQVASHEIGHAIGLQHTGVGSSLMNPTYTEAFSGPQSDDIAGAVANYGAAGGAAAPEPTWLGVIAIFGLGVYASGRRTRPALGGEDSPEPTG